MTKPDLLNNAAQSRFEAHWEGQVAVMEYEVVDNRQLVLLHTEVPLALNGQGIAGQLAQYVLQHARNQGWRVLPICPFMAAYLQRHTEYHDILDRL